LFLLLEKKLDSYTGQTNKQQQNILKNGDRGKKKENTFDKKNCKFKMMIHFFFGMNKPLATLVVAGLLCATGTDDTDEVLFAPTGGGEMTREVAKVRGGGEFIEVVGLARRGICAIGRAGGTTKEEEEEGGGGGGENEVCREEEEVGESTRAEERFVVVFVVRIVVLIVGRFVVVGGIFDFGKVTLSGESVGLLVLVLIFDEGNAFA
jgi:hypothetical protein